MEWCIPWYSDKKVESRGFARVEDARKALPSYPHPHLHQSSGDRGVSRETAVWVEGCISGANKGIKLDLSV